MKPLTGLRVVDASDEKGELCGRLLADLGAEVIRVEPLEGALSRRLPPFTDDGETSLYFAVRNAGKRGASHKYKTLSLHDISLLQIENLCDDDYLETMCEQKIC